MVVLLMQDPEYAPSKPTVTTNAALSPDKSAPENVIARAPGASNPITAMPGTHENCSPVECLWECYRSRCLLAPALTAEHERKGAWRRDASPSEVWVGKMADAEHPVNYESRHGVAMVSSRKSAD
jgi:hypothetical protein